MTARKGLTLIELLVVIGILGILSAVLLGTFSGSTESARAVRCLSNMKNLANACQSYGMSVGRYPEAGAIQCMETDTSHGIRDIRLKYFEKGGWVSWNSQNMFPATSVKSPQIIGMFSRNEEESLYALTNGVVWKYVSANKNTYVCPSHAKKAKHINWSYLMNAYFGWDATQGGFAYQGNAGHIEYGRLSKADRILMFAEVPFQGPGDWFPKGESGSMDTDGVLQYDGCDKAPPVMGKGRKNGSENIGCNHKNGKHWFAHVVFADGHTEKIRATASDGTPLSGSKLKELTKWLCTGTDFSFDGRNYQKMTN